MWTTDHYALKWGSDVLKWVSCYENSAFSFFFFKHLLYSFFFFFWKSSCLENHNLNTSQRFNDVSLFLIPEAFSFPVYIVFHIETMWKKGNNCAVTHKRLLPISCLLGSNCFQWVILGSHWGSTIITGRCHIQMKITINITTWRSLGMTSNKGFVLLLSVFNTADSRGNWLLQCSMLRSDLTDFKYIARTNCLNINPMLHIVFFFIFRLLNSVTIKVSLL